MVRARWRQALWWQEERDKKPPGYRLTTHGIFMTEVGPIFGARFLIIIKTKEGINYNFSGTCIGRYCHHRSMSSHMAWCNMQCTIPKSRWLYGMRNAYLQDSRSQMVERECEKPSFSQLRSSLTIDGPPKNSSAIERAPGARSKSEEFSGGPSQ